VKEYEPPMELEDFCRVDTGDQNPIARACFDVLDLPIPDTKHRGAVHFWDSLKCEWSTLNANSGSMVAGNC
jgi:hypothetical protein